MLKKLSLKPFTNCLADFNHDNSLGIFLGIGQDNEDIPGTIFQEDKLMVTTR